MTPRVLLSKGQVFHVSGAPHQPAGVVGAEGSIVDIGSGLDGDMGTATPVSTSRSTKTRKSV